MVPPASPEGSVIRDYIDWLCELPWSKETEDKLDLAEARVSQQELEPRARAAAAARRPFRQALAAPGISLVAECKQASPSAGVIVADYDPARIAAAYARGGDRKSVV
jgi:indole-3-glycerol phosphate synthase